jgi:hypothetical protein
MLQDTLRGPVLASLPFYDQEKVIALLDQLPAMSLPDRIGWDPVLMSILSACVIHERFNLDSMTSAIDDTRSVNEISQEPDRDDQLAPA